MSRIATPTPADIAREWLQTEKAPAARAPEVARALGLLSGQIPHTTAALKGLGLDVEAALLAEAEAQSAADLVRFLADHAADKGNAKQAKKVLFKWKQQGVPVPQRTTARAPVDLSARPDPLPSFASSIDGAGGQLIFLGGWSQHDGPWCVMAMLTDREGLLSAYYVANSSRTQQKELLTRLKTQISGFTVEVPEAFAAGRLRWAMELREQKSAMFEGDVAEVRRILDGVEPVPEVELALDTDQEAALDQHLAASTALAKEDCFTGWFFPDAAELDKLRGAVKALAGPHGVGEPDAGQHDAREQALALRDAVWTAWLALPQQRERLAARADINAWLLHCTGRPAQTLQAIACARVLRDASRPWQSIGLIAAKLEQYAPIDQLLAR